MSHPWQRLKQCNRRRSNQEIGETALVICDLTESEEHRYQQMDHLQDGSLYTYG